MTILGRLPHSGVVRRRGERSPFDEFLELDAHPGNGRWIVEVVLDTGQRLLSEDLGSEGAARSVVEDMRGRMRVISATMIECDTGVAIVRASRNLLAGRGGGEGSYGRAVERDALAEALG